MKNILIITQKVDENDDHRASFIDWLREFGKRFDNVSVITLAKGSYSLPQNIKVYSLGKERGMPKFIQAVRFYCYLIKLLPRSDGIFAHASAIFVVASWPLTFIFRKKIVLWYLHRSVTFRLKIAEKLCYKIVTAARESLKFKSYKIIQTGHGIHIEAFETERAWAKEGRLKILSVGRISKIKNFDTLLKAAKILKDNSLDLNIEIVGQPVMPSDPPYFKALQSLKKELRLEDIVRFVGLVSYNKIADYYKQADIVIGLTPEGGIDKTILEGMAAGCITLTSNIVCAKYFGNYSDKLIFNYRDPKDLAEKIAKINFLSPEKKQEISRYLYSEVKRNHDLKNLIETISRLYQ